MGEAFTRNLRAMREDRGLLQHQLADACGLRQATVSAWETQQTQPRSQKVIKILCDFFNCDESDLFGYSDGYYAKTREIFDRQKISSEQTHTLKLSNEKEVPIPDFILTCHPDGFVLQIQDTSLQHSIPEGAFVYVDKEAVPVSGDYVAIKIEGKIICRRITIHDEVYVLDADTCSKEFSRKLVDRSAIPKGFEILGRIVWIEKEM